MESPPTSEESSYASQSQPIVVRSCDSCRRKKIRCVPKDDVCMRCIKYNTNCHFTPLSTKRRPRRPAGYKNVQELDTKLKRIQALVKTAVEGGIVSEDASLKPRMEKVPYGPVDLDLSVESNKVEPCRTLITLTGSLEKLESTSNISPSSPVQSRRTSKKQDHDETILSELSLLSSRRTYQKLPSMSSALILVDEAFRNFNASFPIFNQQSIIQYFQKNYSESSPSNASRWACINVVLAAGHRSRSLRTLETGTEYASSCGYMQNALIVVSELTMLHNNLQAVQALLGMAIVLQGTPNHRLCSVLVATAMRLAQTMGLHRRNADPLLSKDEIEERKIAFWTAYCLDRDISLKMGQPPVQDDEDMDVELPGEGNLDDGFGTTSFFNARIALAMIEGEIYKKLYSVKATRQSDIQQLVVVQELDLMLASWKNSAPIDFESVPVVSLQPPITPETLQVLVMRLNYVNCLIHIHRAAASSFELGLPSHPDNISIIEARKVIQQMQITSNGDNTCAWLVMHSIFTAAIALLENALRNAASSQARLDLGLVNPVLELLENLAKEGKSEEVSKMYEYCKDLYRRTGVVTEMANGNGKLIERKEKESVEDFISRIECISAGYPDLHAHSSGVEEEIDGTKETYFGSDKVMTNFEGFGGQLDILGS